MKLKSIAQEARDCRKAFKGSKVGDPVWLCHHKVLTEPLTEEPEARISYILKHKPKEQQALRLRLFRPIDVSTLPEKAKKAWKVFDNAMEDFDNAQNEYGKTYEEYGKTRAKHRKTHAEYGKKCDECDKAWDEHRKAMEKRDNEFAKLTQRVVALRKLVTPPTIRPCSRIRLGTAKPFSRRGKQKLLPKNGLVWMNTNTHGMLSADGLAAIDAGNAPHSDTNPLLLQAPAPGTAAQM